MCHIAVLDDKVPGDKEFMFRTRAKKLADKWWDQILNDIDKRYSLGPFYRDTSCPRFEYIRRMETYAWIPSANASHQYVLGLAYNIMPGAQKKPISLPDARLLTFFNLKYH